MFRSRKSYRPEPAVTIVPLVDAGRADEPGLSQVSFPDRLSPVPHAAPLFDPYAVGHEADVARRVDALADAGALDGYTFDALDPLLAAFRRKAEQGVREHATTQRHVQLSILGAQREFEVREHAELRAARRELADLRGAYHAARAALGLPAPDPSRDEDDHGLVHDLLADGLDRTITTDDPEETR